MKCRIILCSVKIALMYYSFPIVWKNHFGAKMNELDKLHENY